MSIKELKSPIRIYWDIGSGGDTGVPDYQSICEELTSNKILSLQVTESAPALSQACLSILDALKDKPIALSLSAPLSAANDSSIGMLARLPVRVLLIAADSRNDLESILGVKKQTEGKPPVGVSFTVTRNNYHSLPEVLSFCITNGISHLVFPMQRLMDEGECFYITRRERQELAVRLQEFTIPQNLKLIIHDPFVWRVFYPSDAFPEGGCQAANTMLYISPGADVYPCPSLPIKIGNLMKASLKEIILSDSKNEVRKVLITAPQGCHDCGDLEQCKGGCRGRAYKISNSLNEPDPACK